MTKNTSRILLSILLFSLSISCAKKEKKPENIWDNNRFAAVLTEVQLAEAAVRLGYHKNNDSLIPNDSVYEAAFRKMNTNRSDFDSNYNYYLNHPEEMEKIYEQVITNLSQRSAAINEKK
ncbi:MAG: DUF4296 domain-containing protein [Vicingaceae bacterium]